MCASVKALQHFTLYCFHSAVCNKSFIALFSPLYYGSGCGY